MKKSTKFTVICNGKKKSYKIKKGLKNFFDDVLLEMEKSVFDAWVKK